MSTKSQAKATVGHMVNDSIAFKNLLNDALDVMDLDKTNSRYLKALLEAKQAMRRLCAFH